MPRKSQVLSLVLLVAGLGVGLTLINQKQNIIGRAWSGITSNFTLLLNLPGSQPKSITAKSQALYTKLLQTYPDAEVQAIDIPGMNIRGQAHLYYDRLIDKTYVFSRLENLPYLSTRIVRLWLLNSNQEYSPAGISEFVTENNNSIAYSVFVKPGNLKTNFSELVFSYDLSSQDAVPIIPFLNLRF